MTGQGMTLGELREGMFILYGGLRSGTTMLRLMLDGHPDIACPGERDFMVGFLREDRDGLILDAAALQEARIFRNSGLSVPKARDGTAAFWSFVREERISLNEKVYLPVLHRDPGRLLQVFPQARFIHLLRDPRDVARSSMGMGWAGNTWYGIDHWIETERSWDRMRVPEDRICLVRYEELLQAPEAQLTRLCDFLGVPFSPDMMNYSERSTYEPVDPTLAYQWRRKQTAQEVSEVEHKLGDLLTARGYAPSEAGARRPGRLRRYWLAVQNKWGIWRHRIRRFGWRDPILVALTRWGVPKAWGRGARRRISEKQNMYAK